VGRIRVCDHRLNTRVRPRGAPADGSNTGRRHRPGWRVADHPAVRRRRTVSRVEPSSSRTRSVMLAPSLGSIDSTSDRPELFADFIATMEGSGFSDSCIIGYGSSPSRCGPPTHASGQAGDLPVPIQRASAHARVFDHAESQALAKTRPAILPSTLSTVSALGSFYLRGSIPGLHLPRPTLRPQPHGWTRTVGSMWIAHPSLQRTLTTYSLPVSQRTGNYRDTGDQGSGRVASRRPAQKNCFL
jgi:hypothetical protein